MKTILLFDIKTFCKKWSFYAIALLIIALGILAGKNAKFTISEQIFNNSPYQISFIITLVSLTTLFFSTLFASQLLFREADARIELLLFSTPIKKSQFVMGRYTSLLLMSFGCVLLLIVSFFVGRSMPPSSAKSTQFVLGWYLYPIVIFTFVNTLFTTAILSFVAWFTRNKLLVYVSGLLLYIFYMIALIYSGSPMMAQSMPQSSNAELVAAILDPFGYSAFFHQTAHWSVWQRNTQVVSLTGIYLFNRLAILLISMSLILMSAKRFSFFETKKFKKSKSRLSNQATPISSVYTPFNTTHDFKAQVKALFSFIKMDLTYVLKSIPFVVTAIAMMFYVGMEMYAEIEKGIRIPQKYASSGLMVSTIIQNFHILCMIAVLYYAHELFWRSKNANFYLIEDTAANINSQFLAKYLSLATIIMLFSGVMIMEGILFQVLYAYPIIEWKVYACVLLFNTIPLILLSVLVLFIQKTVKVKSLSLLLAVLFAFAMATPLAKQLITFPLLKFSQPFNGDYSDMNGFGSYLSAFTERLIFGIGVVSIFIILFPLRKRKAIQWPAIIALMFFGAMAYFGGTEFMSGYQSKSKNAELLAAANYERAYRKYQQLPQPTIIDINTSVDLYPEQNKYHITGRYLLTNKTQENIHTLLVNFGDNITINQATLLIDSKRIAIKNQYQVVTLPSALLPNQGAEFEFDISYEWKAVNGHQSFNAIVHDGSFMRISRYYPQFGYSSSNEVQDEQERKQLRLGKMTPIKAFSSPKIPNDDFLPLQMTISTSGDQTAIGVGELTKEWKKGGRNYFQYTTSSPIPFRFGVSSARYAIQKERYKGTSIEVYYHPSHVENVAHLLKNAKLTLDYCEKNFGAYPFKTIRFAEISSFTKGFAATAYPATIFMTEDMLFHTNIQGGEQQDVVNELAGHELSHMWWGNSQISPDERDGAAMLTETLAMYTELMLLKKMYGKEKMLEKVKMHEGIYLDERGYTDEQPLYQVKSENTHISYSKGAVIMYRLSELIGEGHVNLALKNFLLKNKYPHLKPISTDFLKELYAVTDIKFHTKIAEMFMKKGI